MSPGLLQGRENIFYVRISEHPFSVLLMSIALLWEWCPLPIHTGGSPPRPLDSSAPSSSCFSRAHTPLPLGLASFTMLFDLALNSQMTILLCTYQFRHYLKVTITTTATAIMMILLSYGHFLYSKHCARCLMSINSLNCKAVLGDQVLQTFPPCY